MAPWLLQTRLQPETVYRFTYCPPPTAELCRPVTEDFANKNLVKNKWIVHKINRPAWYRDQCV
jgi:hypothetical protein